MTVEAQVRGYGFSPAQQDEIRRRLREGESFSLIGRALGAPMQHARRFLHQSGGVRVTPQQRSERHLSGSEREEISRGIAAGESARHLAKRLGRPPSTVSREIARNGGRDHYRAATADTAAYERGRRPKRAKLAQRPALRVLVEAKLALRWPPEQIAGCRPTGRGIIRGMVSITARPVEVEDRKVPGHWEGDLVMGTRPSAVATLVERTSRYTAIVALPDGIKAEQVTPYLTRSLLSIPPQLRRTLTWDRGRETAEHQAVTAETGMAIYLCKPRSPWQRGTDENTNGCFGSTCPRARTSARSAEPTWAPSPMSSTIAAQDPWVSHSGRGLR